MAGKDAEFVFDKAAYGARTGLGEMPGADLAGLEALHRAQVYAIPFENFDILLGHGVDLAPRPLFEKLVARGRGGYCFELNGLFMMALQAFGFEARYLLARVHITGEPTGRGHVLCLVTIAGEQWIADTGFGAGGLRAPIPFITGRDAEQDGQVFRLGRDPDFDYMLQGRLEGNWRNLYSFDLCHVGPADIAMGNHFTSSHADSVFTWMPIATRPTPGGRTTLRQLNLEIHGDGAVEKQVLAPNQDFLAALEGHFGLRFAAADARRLLQVVSAEPRSRPGAGNSGAA